MFKLTDNYKIDERIGKLKEEEKNNFDLKNLALKELL